MYFISIGLNNYKNALFDALVKKYDFEIDFFDTQTDIDALPPPSRCTGLVLKDFYIHDRGINLSQVFRLNVETCFFPIFLVSDSDPPHQETFPYLSTDKFVAEELVAQEFEEWIVELIAKSKLEEPVPHKGTLDQKSILEIIWEIYSSGYSGLLTLLSGPDKKRGDIWFSEGEVIGAETPALVAEEAFVDILTWGSEGSFQFNPHITVQKENIQQPFEQLLDESFKLLKQASILWSLVPNNSIILQKTASESALADRAESFFKEKEETYNLINGYRTIKEIIEQSKLSCPRALSFIANLISLGDVAPVCNDTSAEYNTDAGILRPISILLVDDSKFVGTALSKIFSDEPEFRVLGQAFDGLQALEMIPQLNPDVITLDVEMPKMDGLTALKHIMIKFPRPVIMISTLTTEGSRPAFDALRYGAVEVIAKPSQLSDEDINLQKERIKSIVKKAAKVSVDALHFVRPNSKNREITPVNTPNSTPKHVLAIGTGIGGYNVLLQLIPMLPPDLPTAYLVMTEMEQNHLDAFAAYLQENTPIHIKLPDTEEELKPGICYLTVRKKYLTLHSSGNRGCMIRVKDAPFEEPDCNSLDMMFISAAEIFAKNALGIVLSGSGRDGVHGLQYIARMGGTALVQKPESCLERELPTKVIKSVSTVKIVTLKEIPEILERL